MTTTQDSSSHPATEASTGADRAEVVLRRYDEVRALLDSMATRPPADPTLTSQIATVLAHEGRVLDHRAFDDWLEGWTDDAVLWIPVDPTAHPARDQSLLLDDRRRIGERIQWRLDPSAWGQQPPSETTRVIGTVEAWQDGDRVAARSALTIHEQRRGHQATLVGHQIHEFEGPHLARRTKIIVLPELASGVRNPSFVL